MFSVYTVCFFGHRQIDDFRIVEQRIERLIDKLLNEHEYARYCQGTKLNTQDTLKSISKEIGFFYFDLKSELSRQRLKFKSKDGN